MLETEEFLHDIHEFVSAMDDEDDGFGSRPDSANKSSVCNLL